MGLPNEDLSKNQTETLICDFCGSPEKSLHREEWKTVTCKGCGVVHLKDKLTDEALQQFYSEHYFSNEESGDKGYDNYLDDKPLIKKTFHKRLDEIEKCIEGKGKTLDVGCAMGFFVETAKERSWDAEGLDISQFCVEHIQKNGNKAHCGLLQDVSLEEGSYSFVSMWDYIEHTKTPQKDIEKASKLLRKGGLIVLATPNIGSWPAKLFGKKWMGYKEHEHLYYFNRKDLKNSLERSGFEVLKYKHIGKFISLDFFSDRLGLYFPKLSRLIQGFFKKTRLSEVTFYCNPFDIQYFIARKK